MNRLLIRAAAAATALLLVGAVSACGDDDDTGASGKAATTAATAATASATTASATTAAAAAFPVTIQAANGAVTIPAAPTRIVSLSATATEILFAIGAGPQVTAVDDQSNYPPEAPKTDLSGYQPNVEAVAAKDPDLVVISNDTNDVVKGLGALKIPVLLMPAAATLADSYSQMEQLGAATGHVADAAKVVADTKSRLDAAVAHLPKLSTPLTYYHELDNTYYSVTSKTFIGEVFSLAGLTNIADPADKDSSGYPQLSAEYIVQQDPDLIFLADVKCCGQSAATVAARPGWGGLKAVADGGVIALDDDIASRWGPRTPELLEAVAAGVAKVANARAGTASATTGPATTAAAR